MTLVELLLAAAIFLLTAGGILLGFLASGWLSDSARQQMVASEDTKEMMERIQATPFNNLAANFPNNTVNGPGGNPYSTIVGGYTLPGQSITVTYPNPAADPREIIVTVNWTDHSRARTLATTNMRTSR